MAIDTSLPISNKGPNGSPITDSGGNPVQGVEVTLWRRVLNDSNSDGEGDEITDTKLLSRTQTDSNGEFEFTSKDVPATYFQGNSEVIYYCTVHAGRGAAGSGDPLDNGRIKAYDATNEPAASDYMAAYTLALSLVPDGLVHYYNPNDIGVSTGSAVSTFPDTGSSPEDLSGGSPTYEADAMGSVDAPVYDATDDELDASGKDSWKFLHDGSEFELFLVAQPRSSSSDSVLTVAGSCKFNSSVTGLNLTIDDRGGSGFNDALRVGVSGGGNFVYRYSQNAVLPIGDISIINVRYDGSSYTVEVDATQLDSDTASGHVKTDPTDSYGHGGSHRYFGGAIGDNAIYDRVLSSSERSENYSALANKYGVTL